MNDSDLHDYSVANYCGIFCIKEQSLFSFKEQENPIKFEGESMNTFSTAKGTKTFDVSPEALARARALFADEASPSNHVSTVILNEQKPFSLVKNKFSSVQTPSRTEVPKMLLNITKSIEPLINSVKVPPNKISRFGLSRGKSILPKKLESPNQAKNRKAIVQEANKLSSNVPKYSIRDFVQTIIEDKGKYDFSQSSQKDLDIFNESSQNDNFSFLLASIFPCTPDEAVEYKFDMEDSTQKGLRDMYLLLLDFMQSEEYKGIEPLYEWFRLQYQFIVWKLGSYKKLTTELKQSSIVLPLTSKVLKLPEFSYENTFDQLKRRLMREFVLVHRPFFRMVLEKDSSSASPFVAFISHINYDILEYLSSNESGLDFSSTWTFCLSDGYYSIPVLLKNSASFQYFCKNLLLRQKIFVGQKLIIANSQLVLTASADGMDPTEISSLLLMLNPKEISGMPLFYLQVDINSLRRIQYWARIGPLRTPLLATRLGCIKSFGGTITGTAVKIIHVSLISYIFKNKNLNDMKMNLVLSELEKDLFFQYLEDVLADGKLTDNPMEYISIVPFISLVVTDFSCLDDAPSFATVKFYSIDDWFLQDVQAKIGLATSCIITQLTPISTSLWKNRMIYLGSTSRSRLLNISSSASGYPERIKIIRAFTSKYILSVEYFSDPQISNLPVHFCGIFLKFVSFFDDVLRLLFISLDDSLFIIEYRVPNFSAILPDLVKTDLSVRLTVNPPLHSVAGPLLISRTVFKRLKPFQLVLFQGLSFLQHDTRSMVHLFSFYNSSRFCPIVSIGLIPVCFRLENIQEVINLYTDKKSELTLEKMQQNMNQFSTLT